MMMFITISRTETASRCCVMSALESGPGMIRQHRQRSRFNPESVAPRTETASRCCVTSKLMMMMFITITARD